MIVVGDRIRDHYAECEALGMSREDPSIAIRLRDHVEYEGGGSFVSLTLEALGGGAPRFLYWGDVSKKRYRVAGKTLFREHYYIQSGTIPHENRSALYDAVVEEVSTGADFILFADYNYDIQPNGHVNAITDLGHRHNVFMAADSQASTQMSDITRFRGMNLITPTEYEARLALRDSTSDLETIAKRIYAQSLAKNVIITLGAKGCLAYDGRFYRDELVVQNPVDVCGCGDALFVYASYALYRGLSLEEAMHLGMAAARVHAMVEGNPPVDPEAVKRESDYPGGWPWDKDVSPDPKGAQVPPPY